MVALLSLDSPRSVRNRRIRGALLTSGAARISGILLQVVSLPIAASALGVEGFTVYAMFAAILAWLTLSNLGLGHSTTLHMSRELALDRSSAATRIFSQSLAMVVCIATVVTVGMVLLILFTPILSSIFEEHTSPATTPGAAALFVMMVFFVTQSLSMFEAAQLAQQKQYLLNILSSIGSLVAAGSVWWVSKNEPTVLNILIAVHLPVITMRALNALTVWNDIGFSINNVYSIKKSEARLIFTDGLRFISGGTITNFLCHPLSILIVGATATSLTAAAFAAVMNGIMLTGAAFGHILSPIRGALPEAFARNDEKWISKSLITTIAINVVLSVLPAFALIFFGDWIFDKWYHGTVSPSTIMLAPAGMYVIFFAVEMTYFAFLSNTGGLVFSSRCLFLKGIFSALLAIVLCSVGFSEYLMLGLLVSNIVFSFVPLTINAVAHFAR